jgi:HlyD family secretion protein
MKKIIICILLVGGLGLLYRHFGRQQPVAVVLSTVALGDIEATVVNTRAGTVKACRRALLAPATGGQIAELLVKEGMRVKAGAVLLTLWQKDIQAEVALNRSEARAAEASARAACLEADMAQRQAKRYTRLQQQTVVAADEADRILSLARVQQATCDAARTAVEVRQGQVEASLAQLQRTVLLAPFSGIVAEVNGEVGEYVTPSPPGIPTLPAVDLVDDSSFYVIAPIDEVDAANIRVGMAARITLDAFAGRPFPGRVQRIADYVLDREKQARTVDIEVAFDQGLELPGMLPGYSADAEVILATKRAVPRLPAEALTSAGKVFVFLPATGTLEERPVRTGLANLEYAEIQSGLTPGERVVLTPDRKGVKAGALAVAEDAVSPSAP